MEKTALGRAKNAWGGQASCHANDVLKPSNVSQLIFPSSIPAIRETPEYEMRVKELGHLIEACGAYIHDLNARYKLPFEFKDNYYPSDTEMGAAIIGRKSMLDFRTGTHVNREVPMVMRLRVNKSDETPCFSHVYIGTVFERETFWADDFRTGVNGRPDGGMTIEKALVTFMLAEGIMDNNELVQLWSHMPEALKADECPEDGRYPALWYGQFDHDEPLIKNLQHMIDEARKDDHLRGPNPRII